MNASEKHPTRLILILPVFLGVLLLLFSSCGDDIDPFERLNLSVEAEHQLQIDVVNVFGETLTGYDLTIEGPTSLSLTDMTEASFVFDELSEGLYTVRVSKQGYLPVEAEVEVELPDLKTVSHYDQIRLMLQERTPPEEIEANMGGVIRTAPSTDAEMFGEQITLSFAPDAVPGEMADESGRVRIAADRIEPMRIDDSFEGAVQSYIRFDPEIPELNEPVTIEIPVKVPGGDRSLLDSGELVYMLQPGNIVLEPVDGEAGMAANRGRGQQLRGQASGLQNSAVVVNKMVKKSVDWTEFEELGVSECGEDIFISHSVEALEEPYDQEDVDKLRDHSNLFDKLVDETLEKERNFRGVPNRVIVVEARNRLQTFSLLELPPPGEPIAEVTLNVNPIQFRSTLEECPVHDSGGG